MDGWLVGRMDGSMDDDGGSGPVAAAWMDGECMNIRGRKPSKNGNQYEGMMTRLGARGSGRLLGD